MANSILSRGLPGMPGGNSTPAPMSYQIPQMPQQMPVPQMSQQPNNPIGMLNQIRQFASQIRGNPQQMVMQMIQNGSRTNADLQQAMQMARQLTGTGMFK